MDLEQAMKQIRGQQHYLDNDVRLWVRRWNEQTFRPPQVPFERWIFEPGGICEPLSLRLTYGDATMSMTFNPLTAHVDDESLKTWFDEPGAGGGQLNLKVRVFDEDREDADPAEACAAGPADQPEALVDALMEQL